MGKRKEYKVTWYEKHEKTVFSVDEETAIEDAVSEPATSSFVDINPQTIEVEELNGEIYEAEEPANYKD